MNLREMRVPSLNDHPITKLMAIRPPERFLAPNGCQLNGIGLSPPHRRGTKTEDPSFGGDCPVAPGQIARGNSDNWLAESLASDEAVEVSGRHRRRDASGLEPVASLLDPHTPAMPTIG